MVVVVVDDDDGVPPAAAAGGKDDTTVLVTAALLLVVNEEVMEKEPRSMTEAVRRVKAIVTSRHAKSRQGVGAADLHYISK